MRPNTIVLHCSDTPNGMHVPAKEIDKWHRAPPKNWDRIGYHIVIQPDGYVEHAGNSPCRGLNETGAHVFGGNRESIGICIIGRNKFYVEQLDAVRRQIDLLQRTYSIPYWSIKCHYQYKSAQQVGKTCPNMEINRVLVWLMHADWEAMEPYLIKRSA